MILSPDGITKELEATGHTPGVETGTPAQIPRDDPRNCPTCDLATLANFALDQKPLGPEFEAVWDANVDKLHES